MLKSPGDLRGAGALLRVRERHRTDVMAKLSTRILPGVEQNTTRDSTETSSCERAGGTVKLNEKGTC